MLYLIAFIIVSLSFLFILIPYLKGESYIFDDGTVSEDEDLNDRIESVRLSLRDLDLEYKIGKLSEKDFNLLRKELLKEWSELDDELQVVKEEQARLPETVFEIDDQQPAEKSSQVPADKPKAAKFCPECGTSVGRPGLDKFCRECGSALQMLFAALLMAVSFLIPAELNAFDINVQVKNATTGRAAGSAQATLLELSQGMVPVADKAVSDGKVSFKGVEPPQGAPYMVRVNYKGINYSQVIPPNVSSPADISLEVYERIRKLNDKIDVRHAIEVHYTDGGFLEVLNLYLYNNKSDTAYANSEDGVYVHIPEIAQNVTTLASTSADTGPVRVQPAPSQQGGNLWVIRKGVRPGMQSYQVRYRIPYDGERVEVAYKEPVRLSVGAKLIKNPEDLKVAIKEKPQWQADELNDATLQVPVINLPETPAQGYHLVFTGGTPVASSSQAQGNTGARTTTVNFGSPLEEVEKIIMTVLAVGFIFLFYYYLSKTPAWLQQARRNELDRLSVEYQIQKKQGNEERISEIEGRITRLRRYLKK